MKWENERKTCKKYLTVETVEIGEFKAKDFRERQILGTDSEVKPKGHKLKSVAATTGIKFLFSNGRILGNTLAVEAPYLIT